MSNAEIVANLSLQFHAVHDGLVQNFNERKAADVGVKIPAQMVPADYRTQMVMDLSRKL